MQTSLKDTTPNTAVTANSIEHNNEGSPRSRSWIASLLTPYVRAAWAGRNNPAVVEEMNLRSPNQSDSTMLQDLLTLARRVDELEDEVSLKTAERDQLRVQLEIIRQHNETEREELLKKQVIGSNRVLVT